MLTPTRLILARQRRGLTKVKLAEQAGLGVQTLTRYEAGTQEPTPANLEQLARVLDYPIEFLVAGEVEEFAVEAASFRALKSLTARQRDAALGAGSLAFEFQRWVDRKFKLQKPDIPSDVGQDPEIAADAIRAHWKLGEKPVANVVHLLELHGARVFSLAENCVEVNAFSLWRDDIPFVFLNTMKSPERSRFDAAHELGHLVLHRERERGRDFEQDADRFASAFLMPRASVLASAPRHATLTTLSAVVQVKRIWNVSAAAMVRRLYTLNLISEWQYRTLYVQLSSLGYRTNEPNGATQRETSQVWTKVFAALREDGITKADVARELRLPVKELDALVFGLVNMGTIEGGAQGSGRGRGPRGRNGLRLV